MTGFFYDDGRDYKLINREILVTELTIFLMNQVETLINNDARGARI